MSNTPQPADFLGEYPPDRIIGTESECNIQVTRDISPSDYIDNEAIEAAGYHAVHGFLHTGLRVYPDMQHLEICTGELLGLRQAAAGDAAAILTLNKIVTASGLPHNGLHRHSGTTIGGRERTSGYHQNFMFPREIAETNLFDTVVASHLTSRVQSMTGALKDRFVLSQKVKGIGNPAITRAVERRTEHGRKPMAMIPPVSSDADTVGNPDWARLEVRFADPGSSLTSQFLDFAATSLVLRILEHPDVISTKKLRKHSFANHAQAARDFSSDLTFKEVAVAVNGKSYTALDYQEVLAEAAANLAERIELPEDEDRAIDLWFSAIDKMRASDLPNSTYAGLLKMLDFAPRHRYLSKNFESEDLHSSNAQALEASLTWDRILPSGGGMTYWGKVESAYVSQEEVLHLVDNAPATRAAARGNLILRGARSATWSKVDSTYLPDSYATEAV